jgi:hypothetical protein
MLTFLSPTVKVQYTFDKEGKVNCLARWQQPLQIQTMPLDDRNTIGVIDLRTCLQAVAQCSPEIVSQQEHDYTVYAVDYSEPDVPLVGQGMLSWGLEQHNDPQQQLVTGRVTRNMMALFGNGNKETLEVKLKLTAVPKIHRQESTGLSRPIERPGSSMSHQSHQQHHRRSESQQTRSFHQPQLDANSEWNSFMQNNPTLGHTANVTPIPSPVPLPARLDNPAPEPRYPEAQHNNRHPYPHQHHQQHPHSHPHPHQHQQYQPPSGTPDGAAISFEDSLSQLPSLSQQPELPPLPPPSQQSQNQLPPLPPQPTSDIFIPEKPKRVRNKGPPRPRGRPRKNKLDAGHTSGAEMTDADDGPQPKRAKVTQTDYNATAAFQSQPDSLRVAASISGSLRNMRPVGASGSGASANHLQDVPRAPTPVPNGTEQPKKGRPTAPRRPSMADFEIYQTQMETSQSQSQFGFQSLSQQDARSPTESVAQTPDGAYTPGDSPVDIGSSPPVPRTSAFIQSSPAPSSPVLPPADSGFMSGGMDDYLEDDDVGQELPKQIAQPDVLPALPVTKPKRPYKKRAPKKTASQEQPESDGFQCEEPGPPQLLPTTTDFRAERSPFNGVGVPLSDWAEPSQVIPRGPPPPRALTPKPMRRSMKRTNSAASAASTRRKPEPVVEHPHTLASFEVAVQSVEMPDSVPGAQGKQPSAKSSHAHPSLPVANAQRQDGTGPASEVVVQSVESADGTPASQTEKPQPETQQVTVSLEEGPSTTSQDSSSKPTEGSGQDPVRSEAKMGESDSAAKLQQLAQQPPPAETAQTKPGQKPQNNTEPATTESGSLSTEVASTPIPPPSQATMPPATGESEVSLPALSFPSTTQVPTSQSLPPVPASDPVQDTFLTLPPLPSVSHSEAPCPPSDIGESEYTRAQGKKTAVKGRLEQAIQKGEMPPFCTNCGAIETPTWRKIWCQEHKGIPSYHEYSDKPGMVTTIDILDKTPEGQPSSYRLVKKNLGPWDSKDDWYELYLCNRKLLSCWLTSAMLEREGLTGTACGIWLSKSKTHRPAERWEKDAGRLGAPRRKRERDGSKEPRQRSKRARTKSGVPNPTSEAYFMTDPAGPGDSGCPDDRQDYDGDERSRRQSTVNTEGYPEYSQEPQPWQPSQHSHPTMPQFIGTGDQCAPGSTHSRGSGTAQSPIALEDEKEAARENVMGATRRLLFPSPRKDGAPKVLGELAINVVATAPDFQQAKSATVDKENAAPDHSRAVTPEPADGDDLDQELFGTPPARPSTPPPRSAKNGPFKTPTRPTPSHRPITRSVSRSIRSGQKTPTTQALFQLQLQRTPTQTPRSHKMLTPSAVFALSKSRTPRNNLHAHFAMDMHGSHLDTPFTATLNQLLSEANDFTSGSPSHGLIDMDLGSLPNLNSDDVARLANSADMDFGQFLSAEMGLPSSPPMLRGHHSMNFGSMLGGDKEVEDMWTRLAQADVGDGHCDNQEVEVEGME